MCIVYAFHFISWFDLFLFRHFKSSINSETCIVNVLLNQDLVKNSSEPSRPDRPCLIYDC